VKSIKTNIKRKIQFWGILGPSLIILTLLISVLNTSLESLYLPIAITCGLPLCLRGRMRGALMAIALLFSLLLLTLSITTPEEPLWHAGVALTLSLAFIVTSLSTEEAFDLIKGLQTESKSRLQHLLRLDSEFKVSREKLSRLQERVTTQTQLISQTAQHDETCSEDHKKVVYALNKKIQAQGQQHTQLCKDIIAVKESEASLRYGYEKLSQEKEQYKEEIEALLQKQEEALPLHDALAKTKSDYEKLSQEKEQHKEEIEALLQKQEEALPLHDALAKTKSDYEKLSQEKEQYKEEIEALLQKQEEALPLHDALAKTKSNYEKSCERENMLIKQQQQYRVDVEELKNRLAEKEERYRSLSAQVDSHKGHKTSYKRITNITMKTIYRGILPDNNTLDIKKDLIRCLKESTLSQSNRDDRDLRRITAKYHQLQSQFTEKAHILHTTRSALFNAEGDLFALQRENNYKECEDRTFEKKLTKEIKTLVKEIESQHQEIEALSHIITSLTEDVALASIK
jgi:chromosome segregation ATPase